jgi:hypothetical protein
VKLNYPVNAGFSANDISVLLPDKTGTRDFAHEQHTKAPEGAAFLSRSVILTASLSFLAMPNTALSIKLLIVDS